MPPALIAAGIAAPVVGGLVGHALSQGDQDAALQAQKNALAALQGVGVPTVEEQKIALQKLVSEGKLTPEALETISQGDTRLNDVSTDPRLKDMQMNALMRLSQQGNEGFTAQDRAALNASRRGVEQDVNARNQSVLQNMAQRGMGGSGAELALQLSNSQAGANRAGEEGDRIAAMAQRNALEAAMQSGQLGGQIRGQDYSEKATAATAQDAINRFNAANSQGIAQYNVGGRNDAQKFNLGEKQRISDSNAYLSNQEQAHNKELLQKKFNNDYQKAGGVANQEHSLGNAYGDQAKQTAAMWTGIGQAAGQGALAGASGMSKMPTASAAAANVSADNYQMPEFGSGLKKQSAYQFSNGGMVKSDLPLMKYLNGGQVEGQANFPGDHPENDTVEARLSPGEIVIPRSIVDSSDDAILDFIRHVKKSKKGGK